jgi:hypothetical protein
VGTLSTDPICLRYMQTIFKKSPFKGNGKLSKFFRLLPRGLYLPAGSDTPQNKSLRGIRPCRTRSCRVSDPKELSLVGYQTPQNDGRVVYIYSRHLFCAAWYPTEQRPAGPDTLPNKILQSIRPRGTRSCRVSNPMEQLINTNISANLKQNKNVVHSWGKPKVENLVLLFL